MIAKTFEIRDAGTFIPALATMLDPGCEADRYLLARAGYGVEPSSQREYVVLWRLDGGEASYDPYKLGRGTRTMIVAHQHIIEHFHELPSGSVVDVEFILGTRKEPKQSEAVTT